MMHFETERNKELALNIKDRYEKQRLANALKTFYTRTLNSKEDVIFSQP